MPPASVLCARETDARLARSHLLPTYPIQYILLGGAAAVGSEIADDRSLRARALLYLRTVGRAIGVLACIGLAYESFSAPPPPHRPPSAPACTIAIAIRHAADICRSIGPILSQPNGMPGGRSRRPTLWHGAGVAPHFLGFFNGLVGGPAQGTACAAPLHVHGTDCGADKAKRRACARQVGGRA